MRIPLLVAALGASLALGCTAASDPISAPDLSLGERAASPSGSFVTGSAHFYDAGRDVWRTSTIDARLMPDGAVEGRFEIRAHLGRRHDGPRLQGRIVCMVIEGNQAWLAGVVDHSAAPESVGSVIGFRVIDNGEGAAAVPDEEGRQLSLPSAEEYCSERPGHGTTPLDAGNLLVHGE